MCNYFLDASIHAKLDLDVQDRCKLVDKFGPYNATDKLLMTMLLERLWGIDFALLTDVEKQAEVQREFAHLLTKDTGLAQKREVVKIRARDERMGLTNAPTPAEVKNKAINMWMNKVSSRVTALKTFDELISFWYRNSFSKFSQEVFDQWIIKNDSLITSDQNRWINFLKGTITAKELIEILGLFGDEVNRDYIIQLQT